MGVKMNDTLVSELKNPFTKDKAFVKLVKQYKEKIYWHVRRMVDLHEDADDIVQNVFIKIHKGIENFNEKSKLYTWIYRISMNETLSFIEKNKKHKHEEFTSNHKCFNEDQPQAKEIMEKLMAALRILPPKQRAVFNMRYFDELSYREISEIMGTSEGALKASYHHAAQKIKEQILT